MSKPLTEEQKSTLDGAVTGNGAASEAIEAALDRLDFLERKVRRAEEVMDVIRSSLPLLVQHYEEEVKS